ncbi:hypothetical protein RR48_05571 [Papilio machaon]|uniref:Uncharacterized protein n=1 Tax=Papilio machaon TaxID=76193 RepID=A0A0N1PH06_PAPMA|nr:hypothetical protein RR48_05571 [Papilio machaon]
MVSRRRILSRSRDDLTQAFATQVEEEEDVWYQKDKLYKIGFNVHQDFWVTINDTLDKRKINKAQTVKPVSGSN